MTSTGTSGLSLESSRTCLLYQTFKEACAGHSHQSSCSISIRPKGEEGKFHVGVVGQNFDPADLVDEQKLVNFIHENSGRRDLVFKNFTSLTYWK